MVCSCPLVAECVQADYRLAPRPRVNPHRFGVNMVNVEVLCICARDGDAHGVTLQKDSRQSVQ